MTRGSPTALWPAVLALVLAACSTVGGSAPRVPATVAQQPGAALPFESAQDPALASAALPPGWWRLYRDPRLDSLVAQALAANTRLREASAHLQRALAVVAAADGAQEPQLTLDAGARRAQESGEAYLIEHQLPVVSEGLAGVAVSYEFDLFGRLAAATAEAHAGAEASQAALDLVRVTVAAETVGAYLEGCSAGHQLDVGQRQLELQQRSVAVAGQLLAAGRGRSADLERARAQADVLRAGLPRFAAGQAAARFRLAALLGKLPRELTAEQVACSAEPVLDQPLPVGDGAALLRRRPDVREAERRLAAATRHIGVSTAELYPSIRFGLSAGWTGLLEHVGEGRTQRWALGPLVSWSVPDSAARARVRMAQADAEAALARFDGVVLNALRETETALTRYTHDRERSAALRSARDHARLAAADDGRLYAAGRSPYLAALDADRTLADDEAALAASEAQLAADQVNLFLALGGGWEPLD